MPGPGGGGGAPGPGPGPGPLGPGFGGGGAGFGGFATTKKGGKGFFRRRLRPINIYTYGYGGYPYYGYPYYYPYYGDDYQQPESPLAQMIDRIDAARAQIDLALSEAMDPAVRAQLKSAYAALGAARAALLGSQQTVGMPTVGMPLPQPMPQIVMPMPAMNQAPTVGSATVSGQGCTVGAARYGGNGPT